jgi:hypothetical protein
MRARLRQVLNWPFAISLLVALLLVALAYQFDTAHTVDVGGYYDRVYVSGFHDREQTLAGERFRWSMGEASVIFPGVGGRGRWLVLRLHGWRPAGVPAPDMRVSVNGHYLGRAVVGPAPAEYRFWVPAQAMAGGTARVRLETDAFVPAEVGSGTDPRSLGLAVSEVALLPVGAGGFSSGWPAWDQLGLAVLFAGLLYVGLAAAGLPAWWAALGASLAVIPLAWGLAWHRLWTTIFTSRLAIVAGLGVLFVLLFRWLLRRILARGHVEAAEKEVRFLLAIFLVGFLIKAGGLLYPYSVAVDLKLQLQWSSWIWDGRLVELYGTESPLQWKTMPEEWGQGTDKPLIPYSPYWHITAASFFLLPWRPYDTANVLNVLLDTTKPFLLYFIARRLGLNRRTGLWAVLLCALFPANLLLLSWGNAPTMMGLWWTFAATAYLVGGWERLNRPRPWIGLVFFLLGALLYYTVYALFMGIFMLVFLVAVALQPRTGFSPPAPGQVPENSPQGAQRTPGRAGSSERVPGALRGKTGFSSTLPGGGKRGTGARARFRISPLGAAALALVAAVGLALLIYYGQFVGPIITRTIPKLLEASQQGGAGLGKEPVTWPQYLRDNLTRLGDVSYGLLWPMLLALGSLLTGWKHAAQPGQERRRLRRWLLIAWFVTAFLFFLVGFRIDMVDKEIWFAMPAIALCAAVMLEWLWQRWPAGRAVAVITCVFLAAASLLYWIDRLSTYLQDWINADAPIVGELIRSLAAVLGRVVGG